MGAGVAAAWWFGGAMLAGMLLHAWLTREPLPHTDAVVMPRVDPS